MNSYIIKKPKNIAVIGAGVSGLSFIYSIQPSDFVSSVRLFEKTNFVSGRAATETKNGYTFDNGANYLSTDNNKIKNIILNELEANDLFTIKKNVYSFKKTNEIIFDENLSAVHNVLPKYNYKSGMRNLGILLFKNIKLKDFKYFFETNVDKLVQLNNGWEISSKDNSYGLYDYVILAIPTTDIVTILNQSKFLQQDCDYFFKAINWLDKVKYKKIYSLAIVFESNIQFNFYALINSDREHQISWISVENEKLGRIPVNKTNSLMLIVQMSEEFSENYYLSNGETVITLIKEQLYLLLPELKNLSISFTDLKIWNSALPKVKLNSSLLLELHEKGLFIIGDSLFGKGRVDKAMLTGIEIYEKLVKF